MMISTVDEDDETASTAAFTAASVKGLFDGSYGGHITVSLEMVLEHIAVSLEMVVEHIAVSLGVVEHISVPWVGEGHISVSLGVEEHKSSVGDTSQYRSGLVLVFTIGSCDGKIFKLI